MATAAAALRARRQAAGLSQEQLAERCRLSERTIRNLERGIAKRPHSATLRAIAAALGLSGAGADDFVASWREWSPHEFISAQAREDAFAQELIRQRGRLRDIALSYAVVVGETGLWQHTLTSRTVVAVEPGVDSFAWMAGYDVDTFDPELITASDCVNIEYLSSTVLPVTGVKAFVGSFGRELEVGETRAFTYRVNLARSYTITSFAPSDLELLFAGSGMELLQLEARFVPSRPPNRVFAVRRDAATGVNVLESEIPVPVSAFGIASHVVRPVAGSIYGLRWEWPETA